MSEQIKELLELAAREVSDLNKHEVIVVEALEILERRLLPLLEAGQAMRDFYDPAMPHQVIVNYSAALAAAKERQT